MTNQTDVIDIRTRRIEWGTPGGTIVGFDAAFLPWQEAESQYQAVATNNEPSRDGRVGTIARVFSNFGQGDNQRRGGIWGRHDVGYFGRDSYMYYYNEGLITLPAGVLCLPPKLTTQASLIASNHSTLNAGNRRVHALMYKNRFVAFIGSNMIHDTSTSNPALTVPGTDNITDDVLSAWVGRVGGVDDCLIIGTDDQTDDAKYATAIASTMSWSSLVTYGHANDRIWWGGWFPELGNGWHIFGGKINNVAGIYAFRGEDTPPMTISSLAPVVYKETRGEPGTIQSVTLTDIAPTGGGNEGRGTSEGRTPTGFFNDVTSGTWTSTGNIVSSDNSRAVYAVPGNSNGGFNAFFTSWLHGFGYDISSKPKSGRFVAAEFTIEASKSTNDLTDVYGDAQLVINGSPVGSPRSFGPLTTSDAPYTVGSTSDNWDTPGLSGEFTIGLRVMFAGGADGDFNGGTVRVDQILLDDFVYQVEGTQIPCVQGGFTIGPLPNEPLTIPVIEPLTDDETGITVRRIYKEYDFEYDAEDDRPVGTVRVPPINLNYCGLMAHFQGGVAIAGGANETLWNEVRWRRPDKQVINLRMPKYHGGKPVTIVHMRGNGEFLWVWTAFTDNSDAQLWLYHDTEWHVQGPLQSKSATIASRPLYWAESSHGAYQEVEYNFFPVSTTALAASYQRVAKNPLIDPHLEMSSVVKHDGPLSIYTPELAWVPPELGNAVTTVQLQTHRVDNDTVYGSVQVEVDTKGDITMSDPAIDETFDDSEDQFVPRNLVTATNNPGVSVPTGIMRVTLDHETGTARTPQGLPIVFEMETAWDGMRDFTFRMVAGAPYSPIDAVNVVMRLEDLKRTKPVQRLEVPGILSGPNAVPAKYLGHTVVYTTSNRAMQTVDNVAYVDVRFREVPGGLT